MYALTVRLEIDSNMFILLCIIKSFVLIMRYCYNIDACIDDLSSPCSYSICFDALSPTGLY